MCHIYLCSFLNVTGMSNCGHHYYTFFILDVFINLVLMKLNAFPFDSKIFRSHRKINRSVCVEWGAIGQIKKSEILVLKTKVVWVCLAPLVWKGRRVWLWLPVMRTVTRDGAPNRSVQATLWKEKINPQNNQRSRPGPATTAMMQQ